MTTQTIVELTEHEGRVYLDTYPWPRTVRVTQELALAYTRGDLLDFELADSRAIYRIADWAEDGIVSAELVYEEWYLWR